MRFIKCKDEITKNMLIKSGFKFVGTETINGEKVYILTNPLDLKEPDDCNIIKSNKMYF